MTRLLTAIGVVLLLLVLLARSQMSQFVASPTSVPHRFPPSAASTPCSAARRPRVWRWSRSLLPGRVFVNLRASRFRRTGQRVFTFNDQLFSLGIPVTVTVVPMELTGGYRFDSGALLVPHALAQASDGIATKRNPEFADADENVQDRFTGFHLLGGTELHLGRWMGAAFEAEWATVPDALGGVPTASRASSRNRTWADSRFGGR